MQLLREAQLRVPSCPMVNLQSGLAQAEMALLKGLPRCDALLDDAYQRFKASIAIMPTPATYDAYVQVRITCFLLIPPLADHNATGIKKAR